MPYILLFMDLNSKPQNQKDTAAHHPINRMALGFLIIFFLSVKLLLAIFLPSNKETIASDLTIDNILKAVNEQRSLRSLTLLNSNSKLTTAAQSKSDDMIARHYFAHVDPDGHYIWDKIVAAGYSPYTMLGENLAIEFYDTNSLISAWMNSPTHRANILQDGFHDQGMGIGFGDVSQNQYYSAITNTFGTLASTQPKTAQANVTATETVSKPTKIKTQSTSPATTKTTVPAKTTSTPVTITTVLIATTSSSSSQKTITTSSGSSLIQPRSGELAVLNAPQSGFALPQKNQTASSSPATATPQTTSSASAVVGNEDQITFDDFQTNRYLILICGVVLLLLMLSDIKIIIEKKLGALDKKMNNIVLLVISLIVVAFIYWM